MDASLVEQPTVGRDQAVVDPTRLSAAELIEIFGGLEAPALEEMHGEFASKILPQPSRLSTFVSQLALNNPLGYGSWQSKTFRPVDDDAGRGYNTYRHFGRTVYRFPMLTIVAPSRFDGKPSYQLVYRAFHSVCGELHLVDEVRRLARGRYLGIATWGFTPKMRMRAYPFYLEGPVAPYRDDLGRKRKSFDLRKELPTVAVAN